MREHRSSALRVLHTQIIGCRLCPRLVRRHEATAETNVRHFEDEQYRAKTLAGFADLNARVAEVLGAGGKQDSGNV